MERFSCKKGELRQSVPLYTFKAASDGQVKGALKPRVVMRIALNLHLCFHKRPQKQTIRATIETAPACLQRQGER
jgi:hypothetical protein